jgi:hypothetical protein
VIDADAQLSKPCARRVLVLGVHPAWCIEHDGHDGDCRGVISGRPLSRNDFMPRRTS